LMITIRGTVTANQRICCCNRRGDDSTVYNACTRCKMDGRLCVNGRTWLLSVEAGRGVRVTTQLCRNAQVR